MTDGVKHDEGKPRLGLMPPGTMTRIGRVMTECLTRDESPYIEGSWKTVSKSRYVDALLRHVDAILSGEVADTGSGLPHIDHVLVNAAFLSWMEEKKSWELVMRRSSRLRMCYLSR